MHASSSHLFSCTLLVNFILYIYYSMLYCYDFFLYIIHRVPSMLFAKRRVVKKNRPESPISIFKHGDDVNISC